MAYLLNAGLAIAYNDTPTSATASSGGAPGSTSVVISAANPSIAYNQIITGTGFAPNTTVTSVSGTTINFTPAATSQISGVLTFSTNWYYLTDHNRDAISISPTLIEKESRMANGTMRKFVINQKDTISTSWENIPSSHILNTFDIASATVVGSDIIFVTSQAHNFTTASTVKISGMSPDNFNTASATVKSSPAITSTTFAVANTNGATGSATRFGQAEDLSRPSITTVDGNKGAAWLSAFYNANSGVPIVLKVTASKHNDPSLGQAPTDSSYASAITNSTVYNVFITNFSQRISKRTKTTDYVDMSIEFTEI